MALNLSTLTSPATSGDVLAEALTTADFLEPCPVLRNLARGSNKGGDAEQSVALNQPKALPLIDGDGYLYLSGVDGNYAEVNSSVLPASGDFDLSIDFILSQTPTTVATELLAQYEGSTVNRFLFSVDTSLSLRVFWDGAGTYTGGNVTLGQRHTARLTRSGTTVNLYLDSVQVNSWQTSANIYQVNTRLGSADGINNRTLLGAIFSVTEGSNTNVDFTATNVRHGATKFKCATGQVVTINKSGNDPATIIKKPVLRFDGVNTGLSGLFNQTITDGYIFAAFSVLGDGGESYGRLFSAADSAGFDISAGGFVLRSYGISADLNLNIDSTVNRNVTNGFTSDLGDYVLESRLKSGETTVRINGTVGESYTDTFNIDAEKFNIGEFTQGGYNGCFDLEYLALFPASITDAQADAVRNYINNRNTVFDLKDGFGYYFYDAQKAPVGNITDINTWNGRIVGSDNGDTDKLATQATANDQPVGDGYVVTFADNSDFLTIPSTTQAGWQVVGTSLGTFAYRVDNDAVTELNLLGNLGGASYRKAGDLYGIILLPESATGKDIQEARKLLIDRGAADGVTGSSLSTFWRGRGDIVEFRSVDTASVTNFTNAWYSCTSLTSFPLIDTSSGTNFSGAWVSCTSLTSFPLIDTSSGTNFTNAWFNCNSLTSFPLIDTSSGTSFSYAWYSCTSLTSFPLIDTSSGTNFSGAWYNCNSLTSFPLIDTSSGTNFTYAWYNCNSLTSFPAGFFDSWNPSSLSNGIFNNAWDGCTSLTAQSVENILVSIAASGKYATSTGASGGTALPDAGIDIDYNGDPLSAATTAAITSLKAKGWSIFINSVEQ